MVRNDAFEQFRYIREVGGGAVIVQYVLIKLRLFKDRGNECLLEGSGDRGSLEGEVDDDGEHTKQGWVAGFEQGCRDGVKTAGFGGGIGDEFLEDLWSDQNKG